MKDYAAATALFSNSGQSKVELCHRTSSGDYAKITVSDAAYNTHMAHGDRGVGPTGECGAAWLTLHVGDNVSGIAGAFVSVTVAAFGGVPETQLTDCSALETCYYEVPVGSTVTLATPFYSYHFVWIDGCLRYGGSGQGEWCEVGGDVTVHALPSY